MGKNRSEIESEADPSGLHTQHPYDLYGFGAPIKITRTDPQTGKVSVYQAQVDARGRVPSSSRTRW